MACGDPGSARCAGTQTVSPAGVMALTESFFRASCTGGQKASGQPFSIVPPIQALRGLPCVWAFSVVRLGHIEGPSLAGVLLWTSVHQALKGPPWVGSYSVVQCVRCLMGQPLYCSAANVDMRRERSYGDGSTCYV